MSGDPALIVRTDCRLYRGSMPCEPHKQDGRRCAQCTSYDPVRSRVLLIKLGALGDVLRTTALLPSIRAALPGAQVSWLTSERAKPLLEGNPDVDRVLTVEGHYLEVLLTERFDVLLSLENEPLGAAAARLARAGAVRGFIVDDSGAVVPASDGARHWWHLSVDDHFKRANRRTWFDLMRELCELPCVPARPRLAVPAAQARVAERQTRAWRGVCGGPLIGINTGGGGRWPLKRWTQPGYAGLARELRAQIPESCVVVLGGPEERHFNEALLAEVGGLALNGGCHDDVHLFAAMVERLDVLVTSDSLGFHVATAVGTRVVVVVGPTSRFELETFGRGEIVASDVDCLGCYLISCDKAVTCMDRLSVGTVLDATRRQLSARRAPVPV
jgi:ADP-heptose:LPS heptosyltransferase